jgi:hypothetical protein
MRLRIVGLICGVVLAVTGCGGHTQASEGEGWQFLTFGPTEYIPPSGSNGAQIFAEPLEIPGLPYAELIDFNSHVALFIATSAASGEYGDCGHPRYEDILFEDESIQIVPDDSFKGGCVDVGRQVGTIFALERDALPDTPFSVVVGSFEPVEITEVG